MSLNEACIQKLELWNFSDAQACLDGSELANEEDLVISLSCVMGNCDGWLDSDLGVIIRVALSTLLPGKGSAEA